MKIKNIVIGLMVATLSLTSCSDWFDVTSSTVVKEKELFKNEQGFKDVFTGIYTLLTTNQLYGRELTYGYNDVRAKYWNVTNKDHIYYKTMNYDYTDAGQVTKINAFWSILYKAISNTNAILANIDNDKSIFSPGSYNLYKGEAYALRAFLHFELLRLYGESPAAEGAMERKSIPYYNSFTNSPQQHRSMSEILTMIVADIDTAREFLRNDDPYGPDYARFTAKEKNEMKRNNRLNYWATTALLARVQLYAGKKAEALSAAKEIIGEVGDSPKVPFSINGSNLEGDRLFSKEILFSLDIKTLKDLTDKQFGEKETIISNPEALMMKVAEYNNLFKIANSADQEFRKGLWFRSVDATYYTLNKFSEMKIVPMFRLSELYYIAAEASENQETAFGYLNAIRAGRGLSPLVPSAKLMDELKTEYMREFVGEGQFFYFFKRLGSISGIGLLNKKITLQQYVLPLSVNEIDFGKVE